MEEHKQQPKQCAEVLSDWQQQNGQKIPSSHFLQYLDYFGYNDLQDFKEKRAKLFSSLQNSLLFQVTQDFQPTFSIKLLARSPNYEFIELQVAFGNFIFKNITLGNFNTESYTHVVSCSYEGTFCTTYKVWCFGQELAFKCFHFPIQKEDSDKQKILKAKVHTMREAIREYCLSLIASELDFGPKVEKILGFDIAVYQNCVEFPMEFCGHKKQFPAKLDYQGQLKKALSSAHLCKLIHYDIKPVNICYSWKKRKLVFIDYGFSEFPTVELGELQNIKYRGSFSYVSKEMADIFFSKAFGLVDPYYNDIHCVEKCVRQQKAINQEQNLGSNPINFYFTIEDLSLKYVIKKVKCLLYNGTKQSLQKVFKLKRYQETILQFKREILEFDWTLRYPALFPQIIKILNRNEEYEEKIVNTHNIFCPQPFQIGQSSSQNGAHDFYQKWFKFLQNTLLLFENNCKPWQVSYNNQADSLIQTTKLHPAFRQSYFAVLAEALQINTSKYTLSPRIEMAKAGQKLLDKYQPRFKKQNEGISIQQKPEVSLIQIKTEVYLSQQKKVDNVSQQKSEVKLSQLETEAQLSQQKKVDKLSQIKRVSVELLQYSLSPPHTKNKLKIYEAILINVVVLKAVSQQELFSYYQRLHSLEMNPQTKLKMILKFVTTYQWMSFTIKSQENFFEHIRRYRDFILKHIDYLKKNGSKTQITYFYKVLAQFYNREIVIFQVQKSQDLQQSYLINLKNIKNQKLKQMIVDWKFFTHNYFTSRKRKVDFMIRQRQLFMKRHTIQKQVEYYHLAFFRNYLQNNNINKVKSVTNLFLAIFAQLQIHNEYCVSSISQILHKLQYNNKNKGQLAQNQSEQVKSQLEQTKSQLKEGKQQMENRLPQSFYQYQVFIYHILRRSYCNLYNIHQMGEFYLNLSLNNRFQAEFTNQEQFLTNKQINSEKLHQHVFFINICEDRQLWKRQFKNCFLQRLKNKYKKQMQLFKKVKAKLNNRRKIVYLNLCFEEIGLLLNFKNPQKNAQLYKIYIRISYILKNLFFDPHYTALNLTSAQDIMVSKERYFYFDESIRLIYDFYLQFPSQRLFFYKAITFARLFLMVLHDYGIQKALQFYKQQFNKVLQVIKIEQSCQYFRCFSHMIEDNLSLLNKVQKQRFSNIIQKQLEKHPCLAIICIPILYIQLTKNRKMLVKLSKSLKHLHTPFRNIVKYYLFQLQISYYVKQPVFLRRLLSIKRKYIKIYHDGQQKSNERPCKLKQWPWNPVLRSKNDSHKKIHIQLFRQKIKKIKLFDQQKIFVQQKILKGKIGNFLTFSFRSQSLTYSYLAQCRNKEANQVSLSLPVWVRLFRKLMSIFSQQAEVYPKGSRTEVSLNIQCNTISSPI